ncbi:serine/threonine-protein kinase [Prosthecobacter sp.]|uniref:serine/threonine-protein kinase n=1 Tax=Prosthecobacter sp. TaxID=1965333 RepID=UPI001DDC57BE|nr:serine/threonine-protein kinase [Prosthecobacter sp.]MCB1279501.1 protein kinase [Prosthecobacter sp.]
MKPDSDKPATPPSKDEDEKFMPPEETPTGMVTLGPEDATIAIPNPGRSTPPPASPKPPAEETATGMITLGPEDQTIAIPNPSRALPAATMGSRPPASLGDTGNITLGPEDQTIAIPTNKQPTIHPTMPGAATLPSHGGLPAATASSMASMGTTSKPRSHMESLTGNDGWIGDRYRLLDKLGEGGFGVVYRAEQVKPIHRIVAIKIVKAGVTSSDILGRFAIEQRTLAIMEHPNIARILDAGETDIGAPYFVMEMVKGRSITSYCKQNDLDLRQRLSLFIPVCRAVNHAHQKGIIHRDIKPGNIMVMDEAGKAVPKVIDFGIAKVLEGEGSGHTIATGVDQLVGTPGYISPEQIENGSSHVDTRSDVYALGGVFFELLCGRALITPSDIAQKPIHILLRDLAEKDPPKPSSVEPSVQGDLDWIALKALERDPNRRYGSADDLADDITRYLSFEPITARPPSRRYLITKFVRRHRVGVAASLAIAFAVIAGGITSTALYFKAERNRIAAELGRKNLIKSYSRSDEQMARQYTDRGQYNDAVAFLVRSLRTDPTNDLSSTNLLSLLANVHLIRPDTAPLALPEGAGEAAKVAVSREADTALAVSRILPKGPLVPGKPMAIREVVSAWNMKTGERTDHPVPPGMEVTALEVTPDGQQAVIARDDGNVELWTLKDGKRRNLQPRLPNIATCVAFSGNGTKLLVGSEIDGEGMGNIHAWDLRKPQEPALVMKQKGVVAEIAVDEDGVFAASIYSGDPINPMGDDGAATTWDLRLGQPVGDPIEVDKGLLHVAIEPKHELIALGMNRGEVFVGNFRNGGEVLPPLVHPSSVTSLAFTADGRSIVVGDGGGYVSVWNLSDGKLRFPTRQHDGEILKAMPAANTSLIATVSRNGDVSVFDVQTGALLDSHIEYVVKDAKITRDGSLLVLAPSGTPFVQVWDIHERMSGRKFVDILDKDLITRIKGPDNSPDQLRYSEAGGANRKRTMYAAADPDGTVFVYDAKTLKPLGEPFLHPPAVGAVTITQNEKLLITSGRDRAVRVWDIATRKNIVTMQHDSYVPVLALSPDDERLVTVSDEGEMRVWNVHTGDCLTPGIHDTPRNSSDEEGIVVARVSEDGQSVLFRVSGHGFFSAPMPPRGAPLPEWFLKFSEGLARRHLTDDGRIEELSQENYEAAVAAIPQKPAPEEETAVRWARWLLAAAATRPLSPVEDKPFDEYLRSLRDQGSPAAARELLRYRPKDQEAAERAAQLKPSLPK